MANTIKLKRGSGSDPSASDLAVGEVALRTDTAKLFTKNDAGNVAEIGATVGTNAVGTDAIQDDAVTLPKQQNISTSRVLGRVSSGTGNVEELTAANVRTLINVADGATNVTNTNQLTNGAGFITATLTNEQVQDIVGGMVSGNTETGISVTYQDGDGTLDFVVASQTDENFTTTLKNKLDGIAASATNVTNNNQLTNGAGYITATLTNEQVQDIVGGMVSGNTESGITVTYQDSDGTLDFTVATQTDNNFTTTLLNKLNGIAAGATNVTNNNQLTNGAGYITATLTNEQVQDIVGGMVTGNTESGITVTYQDSDGTLDFSVASQTDENFTTTLKNKLDGIAASATNVTNNNQLTNGAGYITSADGGNAATLDSIDSSQFLRSDTADTATGVLTINGGLSFGADAKCPAAISSLNDGSNITVNLTSGIHHTVTLGGNRTFVNSGMNTASAIGQSGSIFIVQDGTGSRTAAFQSDYKFAGGTAPTLSTAANAVDRIDYVVRATNNVHCVITLDVK